MSHEISKYKSKYIIKIIKGNTLSDTQCYRFTIYRIS